MTIVAASEAYLQAMRTRPEDIIGRHFFAAFPDDPVDPNSSAKTTLQESFGRVLATGEADAMAVQKHSIRRPEPDGRGFEARYWSPLNMPVFGAEGKVAFILHRVKDMTDFISGMSGKPRPGVGAKRRRYSVEIESELFARAQQIQKANSELRIVVEALAAAESQISGQYAQLKDLDRMKSDFILNISHELRTPLTVILGTLEMILDAPPLGPNLSESLRTVERNGHLLLKQINDLLAFSALDSENATLNAEAVDLAFLVRFVAGHFEAAARERRVSFRVEVPAMLAARIDQKKITRALLNLLSNAFKFTPVGGRIRVALKESGGFARLEVADSGPGVPGDKREAVFERFVQLDAGENRRVGGAGLGLAVAREFAVQHGGDVSVADSPEGGALFVLRVPSLADETFHSLAAPAKAAVVQETRRIIAELHVPAGQSELPLRPSGPLVLVVEDNRDMNRFLCRSLPDGCRAEPAFNGREGLEKATALVPDVILCDIMMPELSGEQLVAEVRKRRELDLTPIVVLTAKNDEELKVRMLKGGAEDFLTKPFALEELRARVSNLIARRQAKMADLKREAQQREFVANFSHDCRTPIAVIRGFAEMLLSGAPRGRENRDYVRTIMKNARRLGDFVEELEPSSLEPGGKPEAVDLKRFAEDYAKEIDPLLRKGRHEMRVHVEPGMMIWTDPRRLARIFQNLVTNAIKYNRRGGWIRVSAERARGKAIVSIKDSGIGIEAERLSRVFERHYRSGQPSVKKRGGRGLGLDIAKRLVEQDGNTIWVNSAKGKGTTFYFTVDTPRRK